MLDTVPSNRNSYSGSSIAPHGTSNGNMSTAQKNMYNTLAAMNAMSNLTPYLEWKLGRTDFRGKASDDHAARQKNVEPPPAASELTVHEHVKAGPIE